MMKRIIDIWIMALVFVACSDSADVPQEGRGICLNAAVGEIESRYVGTTPTAGNPLDAWVWFSESNSDFKHNPTATNYLPCRTEMSFDGTPTYAYYKVADNEKYNLEYQSTQLNNAYVPVYCVGFHPNSVWTTADDKTATANINGKQDLMFAKRISGTWGEPFGSTDANRNLKFDHLLTWVKICVCATSQEAVEAWGTITDVSISSDTQISVNAIDGTAITNTSEMIPVAIDADDGELPLQTITQELGEVYCSSPKEETIDSETEYIYTVNMKVGGKDVGIQIPVKDFDGNKLSDTKGKLIILTLYFNKFDMIEGVCTLNAWEAQNEDLYMGTPTTVTTP